MRAITKRTEPHSLTEHRAADHASYENFQSKDELRAALVQEQRGLCCYCMGRVKNDTSKTKIEHWQCQERFPAQELVYRNLLAACKGGEGRPKKEQHCDTRKGNNDIKWNPAERDHAIESRVSYSIDGLIQSDDEEFDQQLNGILNLNTALLQTQRKSALDGLLQWYRKERTKRQITNTELRRELARLIGHDEDQPLEPFSPVPAWWIRQKLEK